MKNLFKSIVLGIAFAGVALAQASPEGKSVEVPLAVIEFSPGANASGMPDDARRQLQSGMAAALEKSRKFDVADVRWTRTESQSDLAALNNGSSTAAAVKLGRRLNVKYVLTGTVEEYTPKGGDGFGFVILKTRLIEVATGKVKRTDETKQQSTGVMRTTGTAEMHSKTVMPAIKKLAAVIAGLKL